MDDVHKIQTFYSGRTQDYEDKSAPRVSCWQQWSEEPVPGSTDTAVPGAAPPSHGQPRRVPRPHLWAMSLSSCLQTKFQRQQKTFMLCALGRKDLV